jgi:protein TonB
MAKLRLGSWQEPTVQEDRAGLADIRAMSPAKMSARSEPVSSLSRKGLLLAALTHAAVFGVLVAVPVDTPDLKKEPAPPMLVSLIAPPQPTPEPAPPPEIVPPEPPKPKPIVKQQKPKPQPKPEPKPEPVAEPTPEPRPQMEQTPPPVPVQQPAVPQPLAAAPKVAEAKPEPQPEPEPVIEPPRFGVAYLNNPPPAYPSLSRRIGEEGRVVLRVLVGVNGKPEKVEVENGSGSQRLDDAALEAVRKWKFIPARRNNEAISAYVLVPVKFSLDG